MRRRLLLGVAASVSLSGCIHASRVTKEGPLEPPGSFQKGGQHKKSKPVGRFWRLFQDRALDKLVDRALARNLDLVTAAARVAASCSA